VNNASSGSCFVCLAAFFDGGEAGCVVQLIATSFRSVIPIKQDPEILARLAKIESVFADEIQSKINAALKKSGIVHFARLFVIDHKYLLVITEFDGDDFDYTEFFRKELKDIFGLPFSLSEKAPPPGVLEPRKRG
jgi:hypothetical protein